MQIGSYIVGLRKERGLKQKDLAQSLNVSPAAVSHWEKEEGLPDIAQMINLCNLFEVSFDSLVRAGEDSTEFKQAYLYDPKAFGAYLQELRKRKNLTQKESADFLSVSAAAVSRWETGVGMPDIEQLLSLGRFFEIKLDKLMRFGGSEKLVMLEEGSELMTRDEHKKKQKKLIAYLAGGASVLLAAGIVIMILALTDVFTPKDPYCVVSLDNGTQVIQLRVDRDRPFSPPALSDKEEAAFDGWWCEPDYRTSFLPGAVVSKNITLYARWKPLTRNNPLSEAFMPDSFPGIGLFF